MKMIQKNISKKKQNISSKELYGPITRAMQKAKELKAEIPRFQPEKAYLFEPQEKNVFVNQNQSSLQILYHAQQEEYKNLITIGYIQTQDDAYAKQRNFRDVKAA